MQIAIAKLSIAKYRRKLIKKSLDNIHQPF